jgi:hypothetical protein
MIQAGGKVPQSARQSQIRGRQNTVTAAAANNYSRHHAENQNQKS